MFFSRPVKFFIEILTSKIPTSSHPDLFPFIINLFNFKKYLPLLQVGTFGGVKLFSSIARIFTQSLVKNPLVCPVRAPELTAAHFSMASMISGPPEG